MELELVLNLTDLALCFIFASITIMACCTSVIGNLKHIRKKEKINKEVKK